MEIIEAIKDSLKLYPQAKFVEDDHSITIFPASDDGFEVALHAGNPDSNEPFEVCFNGWHEYFSDASEALERFAFGLTEGCRLKEYSRGGRAYKWMVEFKRDGIWHEDSTTSLLFVPFWKTREVKCLQNHLISSSEDQTEDK